MKEFENLEVHKRTLEMFDNAVSNIDYWLSDEEKQHFKAVRERLNYDVVTCIDKCIESNICHLCGGKIISTTIEDDTGKLTFKYCHECRHKF